MLFQNVSLPSLMHYGKTENADYSDTVYNARNIYLSNMVTGDVENVLYSFSVKDNSSYVINSVNIIKSQYIYQCVSVSNSFSVFFSSNILDSSDIRNSYNLVGCNHCINCSNLKNKSYCIDNMQYSQEDFLENMKVKPLQTLTAHKVDEVFMRHCDDCIGDNLENCNHVQHAYYCINTTYARNIAFITSNEQTEYLYDVFA